MRVLITNIAMSARTGTEIVTRDFAAGLTRRGHKVEIFTGGESGPLAVELRRWGINVIGDAGQLARPDLIHVNHFEHAQPALARFPDVPAVVQCHDATDTNSRLHATPAIRAWCAVSDACLKRVVRETGIDSSRVAILPNYVDLRAAPELKRRNARPKRWLFVGEKPRSMELARTLRLLSLFHGARLRAFGPY
ncbi:MAG: glycosyltransferase, partial [Oricola sp.]